MLVYLWKNNILYVSISMVNNILYVSVSNKKQLLLLLLQMIRLE